MLALVIAFALPSAHQFVSPGANYHLDYELEQTGTTDRGGEQVTETGTLRHDLGIRDGMERYQYSYKHSQTNGKTVYLTLTADAKASQYTVLRIFGDDRNEVAGKEAYDKQLKSTKHFAFDAGEPKEAEPMQKTIAGEPCDRVETWNLSLVDGAASKCIYWYPLDRKKAKRVGWLEAEMYRMGRDEKSYKLAVHMVTTKIRFGVLTPAEGG